MSTEAPPPCPSSCFKLYYPPGFLGRAEPIRLLFTEAGQAWEEPWAAAGLSHEQALEECERMRGALQQPVFGLPWLEHYRAPHTVEQKEERKAADTTFLSQSPVSTRHITHTTQPSQSSLFKPYVIMHYVAAVCADGRFLPSPYTTENAHRGCQLAEDVEDAWAECYNSHEFVKKAADFIPDAAVKQAEAGLQQWFWDQRLHKYAAHFEKALTVNGGLCLVGQRCSYPDVMLFHWLDGIKHFAPDRYKQLQAPTLKSFYERAVLCPGIAKRLHERKERFTNKAPGI